MTDRTIIFAPNGRCSVRGLRQESEALFVAYQRDDEILSYVFDLANWLADGETISDVERDASGTGVTDGVNCPTTMTQKLQGRGFVDFKATTSAGQVKEFRVAVRARSEDDSVSRDYEC